MSDSLTDDLHVLRRRYDEYLDADQASTDPASVRARTIALMALLRACGALLLDLPPDEEEGGR